jgi:hypothetical protein
MVQLSAANADWLPNGPYVDLAAEERATFPQTVALACAFGAGALALFGSMACLLAAPGKGRGDLPRSACGFVALVSGVAVVCMAVGVLLADVPSRARLLLVTAAFAACSALAFRLWRIAVRIHRRTLAQLELLQREQVTRDGGIVPERPRQEVSTRIDALQKLADLRDRGALTAAEFERQKADLLGSEQ